MKKLTFIGGTLMLLGITGTLILLFGNEKPAPEPTIIEVMPSPELVPPASTQLISPSARPLTQNELVLAEINRYRAKHGVFAGKENKTSCDYASKRLADIETDFSHDKFYSDVSDRQNGTWNENLARNYTYKQVVAAWIASPVHEELLRSPTTYLCVRGEENRWVMIGWEPVK